MYRIAFIDWLVEAIPQAEQDINPTLGEAFEAGVKHGISLSKPDNTPKEHIVDL